MLRVYLMDRHGSPRLVRFQPAPTSNQNAISGWLSVYSTISNASEGTELRVRYKTDEGKEVTAFIVPGDSLMDLGLEDHDITLYMYARNIIPDNTRRI